MADEVFDQQGMSSLLSSAERNLNREKRLAGKTDRYENVPAAMAASRSRLAGGLRPAR